MEVAWVYKFWSDRSYKFPSCSIYDSWRTYSWSNCRCLQFLKLSRVSVSLTLLQPVSLPKYIMQEYGLELPERLSKFESPPSPPSSYDNRCLSENDFSKPPPEVPPQLQVPFLNRPPSSSNDGDRPFSMPHYSQLNHLYIQNQIGGEYFALSSTHRFRKKFVTMVLYKPLNRENP